MPIESRLIHRLKTYLHGSRRASLYTESTGNAFLIEEIHPSGQGFKNKGVGGTNSDAGTAMGAPNLIPVNVPAEGLNPHPHLSQVSNTLLIVFLLPA